MPDPMDSQVGEEERVEACPACGGQPDDPQMLTSPSNPNDGTLIGAIRCTHRFHFDSQVGERCCEYESNGWCPRHGDLGEWRALNSPPVEGDEGERPEQMEARVNALRELWHEAAAERDELRARLAALESGLASIRAYILDPDLPDSASLEQVRDELHDLDPGHPASPTQQSQ